MSRGAPAKKPRRNARELTTSRPPKFVGENRSRPNREETSVREMDAYWTLGRLPNFPVLAGNFPVLQNIFPVNLRREFRKKSLQHSGFVQRNWLLRAQNRKIPC